ncbi:hypothetical protein [Streptomyces sp. NPDC059349]|uniref:hypothetical protein n=1 Tax=Streptomyces sp. NPDC059349 TaxID=3346808 RepID=UPI00368D800B
MSVDVGAPPVRSTTRGAHLIQLLVVHPVRAGEDELCHLGAVVGPGRDPVQARARKVDAGTEAVVVDDVEREALAAPVPVDGGDAAFDVSGLVGAGDDAFPASIGFDVVGDDKTDAVVSLFRAADERVGRRPAEALIWVRCGRRVLTL